MCVREKERNKGGATRGATNFYFETSPGENNHGHWSRKGVNNYRCQVMDDKNNVPSFIGKLGLMLKDKSAVPYVTWSPGGESIVVVDPAAFANQVLPRSAKQIGNYKRGCELSRVMAAGRVLTFLRCCRCTVCTGTSNTATFRHLSGS